jgi:magnesium chelatase accessory protein
VLLVHGTGAATHSWRDVMPLLAADFTVVAPDLPGHGFTETPARAGLSLPGMAGSLASLLKILDVSPVIAVGHSAGAAVLARMCLDGTIAPACLVSLNGAFLPLPGPPIFSPLAKLLARVPVIPQMFAWHVADTSVVRRLMRGTGSEIDERGLEFYARLMRRPGHAAAALGMMANWDLPPLARDLPRLTAKLLLVVGENDKTIKPMDGERVRAQVPGARLVLLPGLGHLAHEERPAEVADLIKDFR